ncbi:MAG: gliding motility protein GldB [Prevotella sp.]|nr:gliding motility protein GldB [Prevotella sp.]
MKFYFYILFSVLFLLSACELKLKPSEEEVEETAFIKIQRYDRLESRYLTTGDFSALQQMSTEYPMETRMLIEDVLKLGQVNDPEINTRFLNFFQDSILQTLIIDAETQYAEIEDLNKEFSVAFEKLKLWIPDIIIPIVYTQITALDQSIVVSESSIGISLDKYLGENYPLYVRYYTPEQRATMKREYILPDCLSFLLISQYRLPNFDTCEQIERDYHIGKIHWVVNKVLGRRQYQSEIIDNIEKYMLKHGNISYHDLLKNNDFSRFISK